jgi:hypothetical protein
VQIVIKILLKLLKLLKTIKTVFFFVKFPVVVLVLWCVVLGPCLYGSMSLYICRFNYKPESLLLERYRDCTPLEKCTVIRQLCIREAVPFSQYSLHCMLLTIS